MGSSKFIWCAQIILSGVLIAGLSGNYFFAEAQEAQKVTVTTQEEIWSVRPANIFTLAENKDSTVCGPLLASLNSVAPRHPMSSVFPLMKNRFISHVWRWQKYHWSMKSGARKLINNWEAAFLDMDGDGKKDGLFRWVSILSGNESHWVWFVPSVAPEVMSSEILSEPIALRIIKKNRLSFEDFDPSSYEDWQYVEIVVIKGRPYLLICRALTLKPSDTPYEAVVQLLRGSNQRFERVCSFDGQILVERTN